MKKLEMWSERVRIIRIILTMLYLMPVAIYAFVVREFHILFIAGCLMYVTISVIAYVKYRRRKNKRVAPIAFNKRMPCITYKRAKYNKHEEDHILVYLNGQGRSIKTLQKEQDALRKALKVTQIRGYQEKGDTIIVNCRIDESVIMKLIKWFQIKSSKN